MRTSEVADHAGVNTQTLRYYERRGLLTQPPRSAGGYRVYPVDAVTSVRFIKRAQELGFSLTEIRDLLDLAEGGPDDCDAARSLAAAKSSQLALRIADLQRMQRSLTDLIATCDQPRSERTCAILSSLLEGADR